MGAVMLFLCIDPIVSMINTVGNVTSNITSTLLLARTKENGDAPRNRL
jgi:Na+/H+-dicarboxylate symporter